MRDPARPVARIADDLLPYLRVLAEQFTPDRAILFGSYAYGEPTADSDVDILVTKPLETSPVREATRIRQSFWPLRLTGRNFGFDILVESPEGRRRRLAENGCYYREIVERGLRVI